MSENKKERLLEVKNLKKYYSGSASMFKKSTSVVKAVDGVNFSVYKNETLGLVGESGCGKSTLGKCILRAIEPTEGSIRFRADDEMVEIQGLSKKELRPYRQKMQMVFQNPYSSLDPRMTILDIISEPLRLNTDMTKQEITDHVKELMREVGLEVRFLNRYPHAFSGGQRQRIGIARALAMNPKFIVADEAVSALDVSVQAQILNLMQKLQNTYDLTYLFIAHDLSVVEHVSDRVAVMYVGKMVELADTRELYNSPMHPYTEALLSAIPVPDPEVKMERIRLPGDVANPANPPSGCYFHPRCRYCQEICKNEEPELVEATPDHFVACHFAKELKLRGVSKIQESILEGKNE